MKSQAWININKASDFPLVLPWHISVASSKIVRKVVWNFKSKFYSTVSNGEQGKGNPLEQHKSHKNTLVTRLKQIHICIYTYARRGESERTSKHHRNHWSRESFIIPWLASLPVSWFHPRLGSKNNKISITWYFWENFFLQTTKRCCFMHEKQNRNVLKERVEILF